MNSKLITDGIITRPLTPSVSALSLALLLLLFPRTLGAAERQVLQRHVPAAVAGQASVERLSASKHLALAIELPLRNRTELTALLEQIYNPSSLNYHQYLTPDQFAERFGPTEQDYLAVVAFAKTNGLMVTATHANRTLLDVNAAVADIERAFHVNLRVYQHPKEARAFYAPDAEPSLDLAVPVLHVSGLDNYIVPRPMCLKATRLGKRSGTSPAEGSGPGGTFMGADFRAAYLPGVLLTGAGQSVGLLEFDGYYGSDITAYEAQAGLPSVPLKTVLLDGFNGTPDGANVEVALDIEMAISMAPGLSSVIIYEGLIPDSVLNRMATDNLARQLSASWLYDIDDGTEQIFQQFAAQGQSFFNASGDSDAWIRYVYSPADDPYITVVGGTTLTTSGPGGAWVSEAVWNWGGGIGTGGGISSTYPIPSWQQGVSMALNQGSTTMRNLPDVALTADNIFVIADDGTPENVGGTSAATPLWAGLIALVNQQASAGGKPPVGFINPAIYALGQGAGYASAFHDITTGDNTSIDSPTNFYAVAGYDLCTGWGTPQGISLINALAPPDPLQIVPLAGFTSAGGVGGPFSVASQDYSLTNVGTVPLDWTLANPSTWLDAAPTSGTLAPGGPAATVTVSLNAAANSLLVGVHSATLWFTNLSDGLGQNRQFNLTVIRPPVITKQPTNQVVLGGATATFAVTASGGLPLGYRWQNNGTNLADGGNISGAATSLLTISNVSLVNTGAYTVVVSNAAGLATSAPPALLTIIPSSPVIVIQPASQTALFGAPVSFAVAALGNPPLLYQWQVNGTNLSDEDNISGSASSVLSIGAASSTSAGTYSVIVSNALGSIASAGAVLTVYARNDQELVQNGGFETGDFSSWTGFGNFTLTSVGGDSVCAHSGNFGALLGPAGSLGFLAQTIPTTPEGTYLLSLWLDSPDGFTPNEFRVTWDGNTLFDQSPLSAFGWTNLQFIVTATGSSTPLELGFQDDATYLGLDDISVKALLSPAGPPVIVAQPPPQTVTVAGTTVVITVGVAGKLPLSYQWRFNGVNMPNATNATLTLPSVNTNQAGIYSVTVSNSLGWTSSSNAALTVLGGSATLVTFDDLGSEETSVPSGYADLEWNNFYSLDAVHRAPRQSGYHAGMISSNNVAYDGYGTAAWLSAGSPFSLLSAYVTAAWYDDLKLEVKGYIGSTLVYDQSYILSATEPTLINFNCVGVTSIQFIPSGGKPHLGYSGLGTHFVLDNVTVVATPLPPLDLLYSFNGFDGGSPGSALAQGTDGSFYGTTEYGGAYGYGTVFRMTPHGVSTLVSFNYSNGAYPRAGLVQGADGSFYGTTSGGGTSSDGTVFRLATNGTLTTLASFNYAVNAESPSANLVQGADGNLYGTTSYGGTNYYGTLFRVTTNGALTRLVSFNGTNGSYPYSALVQGADGNFYGTTSEGGTNGAGTVFRMTPGGRLTTLVSFNYTNNGGEPYGTLVKDAEGNLYGTTSNGGTNGYGDGTIFRLTTNYVFSTLASFSYPGPRSPYAGLMQGADGSFYGTTEYGGRYDHGAIFRMTTNGVLATLRSFAGTNGLAPRASLVRGTDGNIYGTTSYGAAGYNGSYSSGDGAVFRLTLVPGVAPPVVTAQPVTRTVPAGCTVTFTVGAASSQPLSYYWQRNGAPVAGATESSYTVNNVQMADSGSQFSCLVSNALGSAISSNGTLIVLSPNTSGPVYSFSGFDGGYSRAELLEGADGILYGTTEYGGAYGYGTVFSLTTSGTATVLASFNDANGSYPEAGLVQGSDGKLYGTTASGGTDGEGTVFRLATNGTLTTLFSFNYSSSTGYYPQAGLTLGADGNFYGTTLYGGSDGYGTVFRMTTNGTVSALISFNSANGSYPYAGLVQGTDGNFYGTTESGGTYGDGTVFRMTTNGTLTTLVSFNSANGSYPYAGLVQGTDGNFYGTTSSGGTYSDGTVFRMTTNGILTTLASFNYATGSYPYAGLVQGADGSFYGTTEYGGTYGQGTVFRMTSGGTLTNLFSFAGTNGAAPQAALVQASDGNLYCTTPYGGLGYDGAYDSGNGTVFRLVVPHAVGPPVITAQPLNQTVSIGGAASFSVSATGSPPLRYFWRRNGTPIPGATQASYTTNDVQLTDSGSQFSCLVSNAEGMVLSSNAVLTVVTGPPDAFTELFESGHVNDLAYQSFTFIPDGSAAFYAVCRQAAAAFPSDPSGGTTVSLTDESYAQVTLSGANTVAIYGQRASTFFIGSNGYLTMNSGDTSYLESYTNHFNQPRVSALFDDLNPGSGGSVSWKQFGDQVAVTYRDVPEYGPVGANSFQIELFYNGRIRLTYLNLTAQDGLAGLSAGQGVPAGFVASDFTSYGLCGSPGNPPVLVPGSARYLAKGQFQFTLSGAAGSKYEILVSTNLQSWSLWSTMEMTISTCVVLDTNAWSSPRFYRAMLVP